MHPSEGPTRRRRARVIAGLAVALCAIAALSGCVLPPAMTVTTAVSDVDHPWDVGFAGGTMIYTERPGRITAVVGGQKHLLAAPADVVNASEAGMMGLAIDPDFATNRFIYTCFASTLGGPNDDVRLVRWTVDAGFTTLTNRTDILTGAPVNTAGELGRHSGCRPRFGPGGLLWVGTGDAATATAPQNPQSLGGKVLRLNRDGTGRGRQPRRRARPADLLLRPPQRPVDRLPRQRRPGRSDGARPGQGRRAEPPHHRELRLGPGRGRATPPTTRPCP